MASGNYNHDLTFSTTLMKGLCLLNVTPEQWNAWSIAERKKEIKKLYHKALLDLHPDRTRKLPEEERKACEKKIKIINGLFSSAPMEETAKYDIGAKDLEENTAHILEHTGFNQHVLTIKAKWKELEGKAIRYPHDPRYRKAADVAEKLVMNLERAKLTLSLEYDLSKGAYDFKRSCLSALKQAKPQLSEHRDLLGLLVKLIAALMTFPVSVPAYALGLWSMKTDSLQKIEAFKDQMEPVEFSMGG